MLSKLTIIGLSIGGIICTIGGISLVESMSSSIDKIDFDDVFTPGEKTTYTFFSPKDSKQYLEIRGDSWSVRVQTPYDLKVPQTYGKDKATLSWTAKVEGENKIFIENNGKTDVHISGTLEKSQDSLFVTYHILVIIAGIVIIGFSARFS
tara:strand:- start:1124 stop:1573 length:450 start_codon:yes stop_codon:yes gene_type:complete